MLTGPPLSCRHVKLGAREARAVVSTASCHNIELMLADKRIHGDLSAHNILYWEDKIRSSTSRRSSIPT